MAIVIDHAATAAASTPSPHGNHAHIVVVDFGRARFDYMPISMRELIHWTSSRLDGQSGNHRTGSLLRAVAEQFYPDDDDEALLIRDEIEDKGGTVDFGFNESAPPAVDVRLLGLVDGFAFCRETFGEPIWLDKKSTSVLARNAANYLDFEFPKAAFEMYGIRGIRVYCLDLIYWVRTWDELHEMAHQDEDAWLDAWELSGDRHLVNQKCRDDARLRARHGDQAIDDRGPFHRGTIDPVEQDAILAELSATV